MLPTTAEIHPHLAGWWVLMSSPGYYCDIVIVRFYWFPYHDNCISSTKFLYCTLYRYMLTHIVILDSGPVAHL